MRLGIYAVRARFAARETIVFPAGRAGNTIRGALGLGLLGDRRAYERIFAPEAVGGPSGFHQRPRPFVLRVRELEGRSVEAGEEFSVRVNLFDTRAETVGMVEAAMARMGEAGMGPGRGRAAMEEMKTEAVALGFEPEAGGWRRVIVQFLTPVELKGSEDGRPEFGVLAARLRDRTSALARFYGDGAWEADFRGFGERARGVRTVRSELMRTEAARRSSRTGQVHGIGGWVGEVEYEGEMGEFLPFLRAGRWTGVGRQTSWGKGELGVSVPVLEGGPEAG